MEILSSNRICLSSDWLGSDPLFYNESSGKISNNINEVIDFRNLQFHPEGLNNYLDFGYSVFEQTPVKNVKFLRHSSKLVVDDNKITVEYLEDPAEKLIEKQISEEQVIDLLRSIIQQWENSVSGDIIIPTSGGYDSRIITEMILNKDRVRAFTYGLSDIQSNSFEVVYAKKISDILGTKFEQIELGGYHRYFDNWDSLFGISTHAHGMYQIEFYEKIRQKINDGHSLLSGIIGDAWAGSVSIPVIENVDDVFKLGYSHGMRADSRQSLFKSDKELLYNYYDANKEKLQNPRMRIIESMRFKIILLCYLLRVPAKVGFKPWSPFLIKDIALSMLNLPDHRRKNRAWQVDYFKKRSLHIESLNIKNTKTNTLNKQALYKMPLKPLDVKVLSEIIRPAYIERINRYILPTNNLRDFIDSLMYYPKVGGLLRRMGVRDEKTTAYLAYLTLKPLERLIIKRNGS
jgi:hypothetical protein